MLKVLSLTLLLSGAALGTGADYPLPVNLSKLTNYKDLNVSGDQNAPLTTFKAQRDFLSQNGFVVSPTDTKQFYELYEGTRYANVPVFVTTDSSLHIFHLVFDKMLRDLERQKLLPNLKKLNALLVSGAEKQVAAAKGTPLEFDTLSVLAYLAVAQKLADPQAKVPAVVSAKVAAELELIAAHKGISRSSLFGFDEDYSQYIPRGHYTRGEALKNYFRSMMWYGRINFRLKDDAETRRALLLSRLIGSSTEAQKLWASLYDPTAFIVGKSDDLDFSQYAPLVKTVYGASPAFLSLADPAKLGQFRALATTLPAPRINSLVLDIRKDADKKASSVGWRLMGQRFVLDAFIFENLIYRNVGNETKPRLLPKGLDVFAALGSSTAQSILKSLGESQYQNFDSQLEKLQKSLGTLSSADWNDTLYAGWLNTLRALTETRDARYPTFMRSSAWAKKDLHTALGSYTELKHDTLLYAKQVMAEMGSGEPETLPEGYVEPIPEVYARLKVLAAKTRVGLKTYGLLTESIGQNLASLEDMAGFLERVARLELTGKKPNRDDYDRIHYYGGWLEELTLASADSEGGEGMSTFNEDQQAAVVADIATDPNGRALEQATGRIFEIFAVVPNSRGKLQVARGGTYSYYEFTVPLENRFTDDAWHKLLETRKAPAQPGWTKSFIVGK